MGGRHGPRRILSGREPGPGPGPDALEVGGSEVERCGAAGRPGLTIAGRPGLTITGRPAASACPAVRPERTTPAAIRRRAGSAARGGGVAGAPARVSAARLASWAAIDKWVPPHAAVDGANEEKSFASGCAFTKMQPPPRPRPSVGLGVAGRRRDGRAAVLLLLGCCLLRCFCGCCSCCRRAGRGAAAADG